jgi:hypothetical protein
MAPIEGIDISHWQARTPPLGTSLGFVFARAVYGSTPDDRYAMHAATVRAAGKVLGAYAFGRDADGAAQARAFLEVVGPRVRLVALDYERDGDHGHMTVAQARAFIATVKASGRACGLYASESGYPSLGQDWNWVANWDRQPRVPWAFWQYRGSPLDLDRFAGTMAELRALAGERVDPNGAAPDRIGRRPAGATGWVVVDGSTPWFTRRADGRYVVAYVVVKFSAWVGTPFVARKATGGRASIARVLSGPHAGQLVGIYTPAVGYTRG